MTDMTYPVNPGTPTPYTSCIVLASSAESPSAGDAG